MAYQTGRFQQQGPRDMLAERARAEGEAAAEWTVNILRMIKDLFMSIITIVRILLGMEEREDPPQACTPPPAPEQLAEAAGKAAADETVALVRKAGRLIRFVLPRGPPPPGFELPVSEARLKLARLARKALELSRDTVEHVDVWAGHVSEELIGELQGWTNEEARETAAEAIETLGDWAFEALLLALNRIVDDLARRNLLRTYALPDRLASLSTSSTDTEDDAVSPSEACVICYQSARRAVFLYCGHRAACMRCATAVAEGPRSVCPLCRQPIHGVVRVYDP